MVKENKKNKKSRFEEKTLAQTTKEYVKTFLLSFLVALMFTILLSFHARSEMIKNYYSDFSQRHKLNQQIARKIIIQSDFIRDLRKKGYGICVQVGYLYDSAGDYKNAQYAYELALEKSKQKNYFLYYRLAKVLIAQDKIENAKKLINSVRDVSDKNLIKFKSRAYIEMGDKYYSQSKFLSAARCYEKAKYYYDKFSKKDKVVQKSIINRIVNSYIQASDIMVNSGLSSDAARFLTKAEALAPDNFNIKYRLAIIYSDIEPVESIKYFEYLIAKRPQDVDYVVYIKALIKSANISELEGNPVRAKYYRYKIHSLDMIVDRKVVYKNDVEISIDEFSVKKFLFTYHLSGIFSFKNNSNANISKLYADFVLRNGDKILETVTIQCADKNNPIYLNGGSSQPINVKFKKNIFTKKELENYLIDIYLYKNEKYRTLVNTMRIPVKWAIPTTIEELERSLIEF